MKSLYRGVLFLLPQLLVGCLELYDKGLSLLIPRIRLITRQIFLKKIDRDKTLIRSNQRPFIGFYLYTPNRLCAYRADTFWQKEPEILEWISEFGGDNNVFFDIGANIGIYSIYYAVCFKGTVFSFEPSVFNLKQLAKNIDINDLSKQILIVPNPLSESTGVAVFRNASVEEGGALNAFGVEYGHDGQPLQSDVEYSVVGFNLDFLVRQKIVADNPTIIKIDVDGIEHLILRGAIGILSNTSLKSVFIEVNDGFAEQSSQVKKILLNAGFVLREKRHSELLESSEEFRKTYNQIWVRG